VNHNGLLIQDQKCLRHILESKTNGEYDFKHVQFHCSDIITYNLWEKTIVETLSPVYTKNQNTKTVIKTIIDGGHLGKIIDQK
jgi:hypothetical protein